MSNSGTRNYLMVMTDEIDMQDQDRGCLDFRLDLVDLDMATKLVFRLDTGGRVKATNPDFHPDTGDTGRATDLDFHPDTVDLVMAINLEDLRDNNKATRHQHHHRQTWRHRTRVLSCSQ